MEREVLAVRKRVLGAEHPITLTTAHNLAASLMHQGKHDEAEKMGREVLAVQKRVLGAEHPNTSSTANFLEYLVLIGKHAPMETTPPSVGSRVKLHSLQKNPEHNGVEGEVVEPLHPVSGRWGVKIDSDGRVLALKPANLVLIRKHAQMVPAS
jgi:hypothetical protein